MKKKLLSLVLAGAMVASTSVSAFADTVNTKNVEIQPKEEKEVQIPIKGDVESQSGDIVAGAITVTVPTNASFRVDSQGELTSGTMSIVNKGDKKISVSASSFSDSTRAGGIELVKSEDELDQNNRSKVYLKLTGGNEDIVLTSESGGKMYKISDTNTAIESGRNDLIKIVNPQDTLDLKLKGKGTAYSASNSSDAVNDKFELVLKIKQERS